MEVNLTAAAEPETARVHKGLALPAAIFALLFVAGLVTGGFFIAEHERRAESELVSRLHGAETCEVDSEASPAAPETIRNRSSNEPNVILDNLRPAR